MWSLFLWEGKVLHLWFVVNISLVCCCKCFKFEAVNISNFEENP